MCLSTVVYRPELVIEIFDHEGYECVITRNDRGNRCGYLKLLPGHPWHGQDEESIDATCHGSLTFAEADVPCDKGGADNGWWVGFDCGHGFDAPDPELLIQRTNNI